MSVDLIGSPDAVAGQMAEIMQEIDGDGYLIALNNVSRKSVSEITDGLIPALQQRGVVRRAYEHQHLRDNLLAF
jgi:alkanesulfonate monooxygenase SsuD/methylene tetrahydromethanopterin reductase-like flavin-dependent oxidoreductase (luciferase family)